MLGSQVTACRSIGVLDTSSTLTVSCLPLVDLSVGTTGAATEKSAETERLPTRSCAKLPAATDTGTPLCSRTTLRSSEVAALSMVAEKWIVPAYGIITRVCGRPDRVKSSLATYVVCDRPLTSAGTVEA